MLRWRMEFGGENGSFGSGLMPSAQDDRGNLGAFPVLHVILSERSESKNPLPFGEFERMRVLRRASLAQDDRDKIGLLHFACHSERSAIARSRRIRYPLGNSGGRVKELWYACHRQA